MAAPKTLDGKIVLQAYMLDNSYKTLLVEPSSTVHDVCRRRECPPPRSLRRVRAGAPPLLPSSLSHAAHSSTQCPAAAPPPPPPLPRPLRRLLQWPR